jgi:hypothetical protein
MRQMVLQCFATFTLEDFRNLPFFCYLPQLDAFPSPPFCNPDAWHPTCLLLRGASSNPVRSSVDEK